MCPASDDDILLDTRERLADAEACAAEWAATVVRLGLQKAYGVRVARKQLPGGGGRPFMTFGVYLSMHDGVTPDAASRAALRALSSAATAGRR